MCIGINLYATAFICVHLHSSALFCLHLLSSQLIKHPPPPFLLPPRSRSVGVLAPLFSIEHGNISKSPLPPRSSVGRLPSDGATGWLQTEDTAVPPTATQVIYSHQQLKKQNKIKQPTATKSNNSHQQPIKAINTRATSSQKSYQQPPTVTAMFCSVADRATNSRQEAPTSTAQHSHSLSHNNG